MTRPKVFRPLDVRSRRPVLWALVWVCGVGLLAGAVGPLFAQVAVERATVETPPAAQDAAAAETPAGTVANEAAAEVQSADAQSADPPPVADAPPADPSVTEINATAAGALIRVPLPITGSVDTQVKRAVKRALERLPKGNARPALVLEFVPPANSAGAGSDFGRALSLAQFLSSRDLAGAKTVAYLPRSIQGHSVLAAMACEEIVMAPDATIGEAGVDLPLEESIDPTIRSGYLQIARLRRTIPSDVALGMLDKDLEVLQVETEVSTEYVLKSDLEALKQKRAVQSEKLLKQAGELGRFTGRQARELGFAKYLAGDRAAVARALSLPVAALDEDPSLDGSWRPVRIPIKGEITDALVRRLERMIEEQIRDHDINFICFAIDSPGGFPVGSMRLANTIAALDPAKVRTVAFVAGEARADAALVVLACDQIVVTSNGLLGGPGAADIDRREAKAIADSLRDELAPRKLRSWSLPAALIDGDLPVYRYTLLDKNRVDYFSEEEAQSQPDAAQWAQGELITKPGEPLRLRGKQVEQFGLARHVVRDFAEFKEQFGLGDEFALAEPNWADFLIDALASPSVQLLLLLVGGAALYAELQSPGIGVGGFTSAICFLLWFWAKHLNGTAGWLEAILFIAGVCSILLELFVLPGVGIFALGGGLMIIISLVLASQTFVLPHNDYQMEQLRDSLVGLAGAGVGVIVAAILLRRYAPHTPLLSNMMLEPPSGEELEEISHRESMVNFEHLRGQYGQTTTQLTPSGKALFGNELVDVIADGQLVPRGTPIEVVDVRGNRVLVRSLATG